jgi:hypothetical protein
MPLLPSFGRACYTYEPIGRSNPSNLAPFGFMDKTHIIEDFTVSCEPNSPGNSNEHGCPVLPQRATHMTCICNVILNRMDPLQCVSIKPLPKEGGVRALEKHMS